MKNHLSLSPRASSILIVDDQSLDIEILVRLTHEIGYKPVVAFDGAQALELVKTQEFEFIILDWNMPILAGWAFLKRIELDPRELGESRQSKVILYSSEDLDCLQNETRERLHIVDIWRKPLGPVQILHRLKKLKER